MWYGKESRHQLSRRQLLRAASAGGMAIAAVGLTNPLAQVSAAANMPSGTITQGIDEQTEIKTIVDQYFKTKYEGQRIGIH